MVHLQAASEVHEQQVQYSCVQPHWGRKLSRVGYFPVEPYVHSIMKVIMLMLLVTLSDRQRRIQILEAPSRK